jgi:hypothetical protein
MNHTTATAASRSTADRLALHAPHTPEMGRALAALALDHLPAAVPLLAVLYGWHAENLASAGLITKAADVAALSELLAEQGRQTPCT